MARASKKVFLQVLWTGVDSSVPSLFLFTDTKRYIFNCGEGLQRLFTQSKIKIAKLDTFFLTRYQWSHMGGLPGFGMTLRDVKSHMIAEKEQLKNRKTVNTHINSMDSETKGRASPNTINVHAPQSMQRVMYATKYFMRFDTSGVSFNVIEHGTYHQQTCNNDIYKDQEIAVHPIPLYDGLSGSSHKQLYSSNGYVDSINVSPRFTPPSLCYGCHVHPVPGKFLIEKAKELKIPRGPLYSKLTNGETVVLEDGRKITPDQVVEAPLPGPIFLIIDCPSPSYVNNLIKNEKLKSYMTAEQSPQLVYHLTKKNVCDMNAYVDWINRFPKSTKHVFLDQLKTQKIVFKSQYNIQTTLNYIHPQVFPLIDQQKSAEHNDKDNRAVFNFTKFNLRETITSFASSIDDSEVYEDNKNDAELLTKAKELLESIHDKTVLVSEDESVDLIWKNKCMNEEEIQYLNENNKRPLDETNFPDSKRADIDASGLFPRVVCLGTGAAIPSKRRNVSATLVFMSEDDAVLFDCGEDTYGQLVRHYGDEVDGILVKIKLILISHMHADHHLGLITVLRKLAILPKKETIFVVAPASFSNWLSQYAEVSETLTFKMFYVTSAEHVPPPGCSTLLLSKIKQSMLIDDQTEKLRSMVKAVKVDHPGSAHGFVVCYNSMKITYSGDTMPCDNLIKAGENSTLLIHEATLNDEMVEEALARKHSTTAQALDVAERMKAQYVLLTHFSQRYPTMPDLKNTTLAKHTAFAFDHMEITLADIPQFHGIIPKLTSLFTDESDEKLCL